MGKYRTLSKSNQYYLPEHTRIMCIHYARQYSDWKALLSTERDTRGAIRYDKDHVQTSGDFDSTSETAMRMMDISEKVARIDDCIEQVCDDKAMEKWLRLGVCYGFSIYQLSEEGMPCSRKIYYPLRRKFYYELAKKI